MINNIITEGNTFLDSNEYVESLENIGEDLTLTSNQLGYLSTVIASVILGDIKEDDFTDALIDTLEFNDVEAASVFPMVKEKIFRVFKSRVAKFFTEESVKPVIGADKLKPILPHVHIENPSRSVREQYVLIDDTVDERPKLQDHYAD